MGLRRRLRLGGGGGGGGVRARRQSARKHRQPCTDRREAEELEAGERDDADGQQDHAGGEQHDARDRGRAEATAEPGDAQTRRHEREEGQTEPGRGEVVEFDAHRDRDEADDGEVESGGDHRHAERARGAAAGRGGQDGDDDDPVRRQEESRDDRGRVEDVGGEVVEGAELREVQLPPLRIARGDDGDRHADGESRHGAMAEVMGGMPRDRSGDRPWVLGDARAFGKGEEGQRAHVLCVRRYSDHADPPSRTPRRSSRAARTGSPDQRTGPLGTMITLS